MVVESLVEVVGALPEAAMAAQKAVEGILVDQRALATLGTLGTPQGRRWVVHARHP